MDDSNVFPIEDVKKALEENFVYGLPRELHVGGFVEIWLQRDDGTEYFEGFATLVEQLEPVISKQPYIYINLGDKKTVNAIKLKWKVKPLCTSIFDDCKERVRWVRKFHSFGIVPIKDAESPSEI